ncbi:MAG: hypothetical protein GX557_12615 [Chloroflexi bacterium]|nr:hypothetical protein [Chloroflexota bacterium]
MTGFEQGFVLAIALVLLWMWVRRARKRSAQPSPPPAPPPKRRLSVRTLLWLCIVGLVAWAILRFVFTN